MTTQIHGSTTCTAGLNGQPCEMCQFASKSPLEPLRGYHRGYRKPPEEEKTDSSPPSAPVIDCSAVVETPDFEHEWNSAPRSIKNYVEREVAEYFYLRGLRTGMRLEFENTNQTLRSLIGKLSQ